MKSYKFKFCIVSLLSLIGCFAIQAEDWSKFGFKGKVVSAQVNSENHGKTEYYEFNVKDGSLIECLVQYGFGYTYKLSQGFKRTSSAFKGGNCTITFKNKKMSTLSFTMYPENEKYIAMYTFGANGQLEGIDVKKSWVETSEEYVNATAAMNAAVAKANRLKAELAKLPKGSAQYKAKQREYDAAAKAANVNSSAGYNVTHRENKSENFGRIVSFSQYSFDEFGNWTKRYVNYEEAQDGWEYQTIEYDPDFWSEKVWTELEKSGDLNKVEQFYSNSITTSEYKAKAKEYWNAHILETPGIKLNGDRLLEESGKMICSDVKKNELLELARPLLYEKYIEPERDFRELQNWSSKDYMGPEYLSKISEKAQKMYADSVAYLTNQAKSKYESKAFDAAINYAEKGLDIAENNTELKDIIVDSEYQLLLVKHDNETANCDDYTAFLEKNPKCKYVEQVNKYYDHQYFVEHRGRFWHVGIAADASFGKSMMDFSGGIGVRLGYTKSLVNGYLGIQYGYTEPYSTFGSKEYDFYKLNGVYLSLPIMVRFNLIRDYDNAFYVGVGANLNINTKAKLKGVFRNAGTEDTPWYEDEEESSKYTEEISTSKDLFSNSFSVSPRLSVGYTWLRSIEVEAFVLYNIKPMFSESGLDDVIHSLGTEILNTDHVYTQTQQKVQGGISLRLLF